MTKIKFCGLRREEDIEAVNELRPDYIGFVFAEKSKRFVTRERAAELKRLLSPGIPAVGVFVDAPVDTAAGLLNDGIIDMAQLHGHEDEAYITVLRKQTDRQIIRAFRVRSREDIPHAEASQADLILLDAGAGDGKTFEWDLAESVRRPYFLAGGLTAENAEAAINRLHPFALDVSSGIETNGVKDKEKMRAFLRAVRGTEA
jgi:phosphoribosylanthranilate isomerase